MGAGVSVSGHAACLTGGYTLDSKSIYDVVPHPTEVDTLFAIQNPNGPDSIALLKSCDGGVSW
jgi:hypothetical protein